MEFRTCANRYFTNWKGVGHQFNAIQITGTEAAGFELYFPRPFMLTALVQLQSVPQTAVPGETVPDYQQSIIAMDAAAEQTSYKDLFPALFIGLALANCEPYDSDLPGQNLIEYIEPGPQGTDYRYYFSRSLNDQVVYGQKEETYNTFIQPESLVREFWAAYGAATPDVWYPAYLQLCERLFKQSDLRLWGAPGRYKLYPGPANLVWQPTVTGIQMNDD